MKNIHLIPTDKPSRLAIENKELILVKSIGNYINAQHIYITSDEEIKIGDWFYSTRELIEKAIINYPKEEHFGKIILTTDQDLINDGVQAINDEFLEWFVKNPSCEEVDIEKIYHGKATKHFLNGNVEIEKIENYKIIIPKEEGKQFFTDYPITELGDEEFKEAPIRQCKLISYDNNKYCYVKVEGIETEIKRMYIYTKYGRCGEVNCISVDEIKELLKEEPKQETLEEAAEKEWGNVHRTGVLGFIEGAKWQQERMYSEEEVKQMFNRYNEFIAHHEPKEWQLWIDKQFKKK